MKNPESKKIRGFLFLFFDIAGKKWSGDETGST